MSHNTYHLHIYIFYTRICRIAHILQGRCNSSIVLYINSILTVSVKISSPVIIVHDYFTCKFIKQPELPLLDGSITCSVSKCQSFIMWKIFTVTSGEEYKVPGNKETCNNNDNIYESTFILPPDPVTIVAQCEERKVLSSRTTTVNI